MTETDTKLQGVASGERAGQRGRKRREDYTRKHQRERRLELWSSRFLVRKVSVPSQSKTGKRRLHRTLDFDNMVWFLSITKVEKSK